jgi:hypothetical protein
MRPYQLVQKVKDLDGSTLYILPPNPIGNPFEMLVAKDWVQHPEEFEKVRRGQIQDLVPDGQALLERNFRENKRLGFKHNWKELWGREAGKTCIIVSCGPSLTESVDEIRALRSKPGYFTLGINRALRATPCDYFFAEDRRAASDSSGISDWIQDDPRNTTLIATTTVCSDIVPHFRNRYWGEHYLTAQPSRCTPLGTAMAITLCDAMHAAYKLGAKEILLYGCDFAISGGRNTGAKGPRWRLENYYHDVDVPHGLSIRPPQLRNPVPMVGINGKLVFVNWELVCNAAYTTAMALMLEGGGVRVRNCSPQGILEETWHEHGIQRSLPICSTSAAQPG